MNKIALLIPASLILAGCTLGPAKSAPISGTEQQKAEKLAQIMASGGQADCQIKNLSDQSSTQIIISGKKMKFVGSDMGNGKTGTMVNDGVYTYIWSEGENVGFKAKIESLNPTGTPEDDSQLSVPDTTQQVETYSDETKYSTDCVKRSISDSEFTPPSDVNFTDFAEMMKGLPSQY